MSKYELINENIKTGFMQSVLFLLWFSEIAAIVKKLQQIHIITTMFCNVWTQPNGHNYSFVNLQ